MEEVKRQVSLSLIQFCTFNKPCVTDKKRAGVPTGNAVSEDNKAYATLKDESKFEATAMPGAAKSAKPGAKLDKVANANPAYQTIINNDNFEPSQKGKSVKK